VAYNVYYVNYALTCTPRGGVGGYHLLGLRHCHWTPIPIAGHFKRREHVKYQTEVAVVSVLRITLSHFILVSSSTFSGSYAAYHEVAIMRRKGKLGVDRNGVLPGMSKGVGQGGCWHPKSLRRCPVCRRRLLPEERECTCKLLLGKEGKDVPLFRI